MLIFHSPMPVIGRQASGSGIRPAAMLRAFQDLGVETHLVDGPSWERSAKWKSASRFRSGVIGVYSEFSTTPMMLTDPDHVPRAPFHDFRQFAHLRKGGVPVAAFYRDVYWRFPHYATMVPWHKRMLALAFYQLEVRQLSRHVDHVFLPSIRMKHHVPYLKSKPGVSALPPGGALKEVRPSPPDGPLRLFYVGGVGGEFYDVTPMLRAVESVDGVRLVLCCREQEWDAARSQFGVLHNVEVVHCSGDQLDSLYQSADIFLMWRKMVEYLRFAMPVKLGEAIGRGLPIITNADCEMGDVVQAESLGWTPRTEQELTALLIHLRDHRDEVIARQAQVMEVRAKHSWLARAETVLATLRKYRPA